MSKYASRVAALSMLFALAACGGGGGGGSTPPPPPPPPAVADLEGAYGGALSGSDYSAFQLIVLENGESWSLYGDIVGNAFAVAGFTHSHGTSNGDGTFDSQDLRDYSASGVLSGTVSGEYEPDESVTGTIVYSGLGTVAFEGTSDAVAPYVYDQPAVLADIVDDWQFVSLDGSVGTATIDPDGTFTLTTEGCEAAGTIQPRASGKNVFDVSVTFGPAPCLAPGVSASGIGIFKTLAGGPPDQQLIVGLVSADGTLGTMAVGQR